MSVLKDQHTEFRRCHLGGALYLLIEGVLWLTAAVLGTLNLIPAAMLALLFGGMFIHPLATVLSRLMKLQSPDDSNRLPVLTTWVALTVPLGIPLILMATSSGNENLFFPAFTILVGAHWLPFAYIYSMKSFIALAGVLVLTGVIFGFVFTQSFFACGFWAGGFHLLFAFLHFHLVGKEISQIPDP